MQNFTLALRHLTSHACTYITVIFALNGPWLLCLTVLAMAGYLTKDAVQAVSGLFGLFILPLSTGITAWLFDRFDQGETPTLSAAIRAVLPRWKDLIAAYLSVGLITLGWIGVAVLPIAMAMLVLQLKSPLWLYPFAMAAVIYVTARYVFLEFLIIFEKKEGWVARRTAPLLTKGMMMTLIIPVVLMNAPLTLSEFLYDSAANWLVMQMGLAAYLPHPEHLFAAVFLLVTTLLYLVPQRYFYQVYKELKRPA